MYHFLSTEILHLFVKRITNLWLSNEMTGQLNWGKTHSNCCTIIHCYCWKLVFFKTTHSPKWLLWYCSLTSLVAPHVILWQAHHNYFTRWEINACFSVNHTSIRLMDKTSFRTLTFFWIWDHTEFSEAKTPKFFTSFYRWRQLKNRKRNCWKLELQLVNF